MIGSSDLDENDLLKIAKTIIARIYGKSSNDLLSYLIENEYIAEETLSQDTGIKSNEGRKILQYLSDEAIVVPDKVRIDGSVLHVWRLNKSALLAFVAKKLKKTKEKLELRMKYEAENTVYECPQCKRTYTLEVAFVNDFHCQYDGSLLIEETNKDIRIKTLKEAIERVEYLVKRVEQTRY
jgi:transcription initiation factor TFIIE subunit alpha